MFVGKKVRLADSKENQEICASIQQELIGIEGVVELVTIGGVKTLCVITEEMYVHVKGSRLKTNLIIKMNDFPIWDVLA